MSLTYKGSPFSQLVFKTCGPPRGQLMESTCCGDCSARPCTDCPETYTLVIEKVAIGPPYNLNACSWEGTYTCTKTGDPDSCVWNIEDPPPDTYIMQLRLHMSGGSINDYCGWDVFCLRLGTGGTQFIIGHEREDICPYEGLYGYAFEVALGSGAFVGYGKATVSA